MTAAEIERAFIVVSFLFFHGYNTAMEDALGKWAVKKECDRVARALAFVSARAVANDM